MVLYGHVKLDDLVVMVDEDVNLGHGNGECLGVKRHGFIGQVGMTFHTSGSSAFDIELCKRSL